MPVVVVVVVEVVVVVSCTICRARKCAPSRTNARGVVILETRRRAAIEILYLYATSSSLYFFRVSDENCLACQSYKEILTSRTKIHVYSNEFF